MGDSLWGMVSISFQLGTAPVEAPALITFKTAHYAPRLLAEGVNVAEAEAFVTDAVSAMRGSWDAGSGVWGRFQLNGVLLEYRAIMRSDGIVNVGTLFPVK
ncbi:hypothetical protein [Nitrospirillum viridazoti]|uniref:hypothetical protein n=1 Tax=Nitrospirillum viridazoti TaxID=3144925 RepID=UPI00110FF35A|nr:hypothetical protein [Nitrospirillum amazonense]